MAFNCSETSFNGRNQYQLERGKTKANETLHNNRTKKNHAQLLGVVRVVKSLFLFFFCQQPSFSLAKSIAKERNTLALVFREGNTFTLLFRKIDLKSELFKTNHKYQIDLEMEALVSCIKYGCVGRYRTSAVAPRSTAKSLESRVED